MRKGVREGFKSWRQSSFAPFKLNLFRSLWLAALASNIGAAVQTVGASWSMITMSASPQVVALVQTAATLPIVVLAVPAGALADNFDRRLLMLAAQALGASSAAALAVLSFGGLLSPPMLLALTALIGSAVALYQPAWQASLGDLVPRTSLPAAISLGVLGFNLARSVGPAVGGVLIASAGPSVAFAFNAVSFVALICVLAVARFPKSERRHPPEHMVSAMAAGLRFVGLSSALQRIYLRGGLFGFGASAVWSLLPVVAHQRLDGGPMTFGLLMGSLGVGSLCGAVVASSVRFLIGNNAIVTLSTGSFGLAALGLAVSPVSVFSAMLAFVAGVSWIFVFTTTRTCVQLSSPRWVVGRTVSLGQVASFGAMSVGAICWGALANRFGVIEALLAAGAFMVLSTLAASTARLPATDSTDAGPPQRLDIPPPSIAPGSRIGPVVVTIDYDVPAARVSEFLELMSKLGRIRRRNGATAWAIQQDMDDTESWTERIHSPNWHEHLRRLDRYTADDRQLIDRAAAFRTTRRRPVRRMVERPRDSLPSP